MKRLFLISLVMALGLSGCFRPGYSPFGEGTGLSAWMDQPMNGSHLPLAPLDVLIHAYDPTGIMQVEFSVDSAVVANLTSLETEKLLSMVKTTWNPPAAGEFTLQVRALNGSGAWSSYASSVVFIGEATQTATLTSTPTIPVASTTPVTSPTSTETATPTPTETQQATLTPGTINFTSSAGPASVSYGNCQPNSVEFQVTLGNFDQVNSVVIFYRAADANTGEHPDWGSDALNPRGGGVFSRSVSVESIPGYNQYNQGVLQYQYVATDSASNVVGRSKVFYDISIVPCGQQAPPQSSPNPNATPT